MSPKADPSALNPIALRPKSIDSIRSKLLLDTVKFNRSDLIYTPSGTINTKSYSPLFFINMRYLYKLDIVDGKDVSSFINSILIDGQIESINFMDAKRSEGIFGSFGSNGTLIIQLKANAEVNFEVAGFKRTKNGGNNFFQRRTD